MRLHIGKAFNSLKLTDYLEEEEEEHRCFSTVMDDNITPCIEYVTLTSSMSVLFLRSNLMLNIGYIEGFQYDFVDTVVVAYFLGPPFTRKCANTGAAKT